MVGVVLEEGEAIEEAGAALVDEEGGFDAGGGVAEALQDFGPALDAVGVGGAEGDAEVAVMGGDGGAVDLAAEEVGAGDEAGERQE